MVKNFLIARHGFVFFIFVDVCFFEALLVY
jgi:hypothetical protein